ncbi:MAG: DUF6056 family protein [Anaerofustis sp.]
MKREMAKKRFGRIYSWDYFPFLILMLGMLVVHLGTGYGILDDAWYLNNLVLKDNGIGITSLFGMDIGSYLVQRYQTGTSDLVIEFAMVMLVSHRALWIIGNLGMVLLFSRCVSMYFPTEDLRTKNWMIVCLMFIFPFCITGSTGWVVTSMNYLWVPALGLYAMLPLYKSYHNYKMKWYEYFFCTLALIYAANEELMCIFLTGMFLVGSIYLAFSKKSSLYVFLQTLICIGGVILVLICPGNAARSAYEIADKFPSFLQMSFFQKIELGYSSTLYHIIMKPNVLFTIFCAFLAIALFFRTGNRIIRTIGMIPLISSLVLGIFGNEMSEIFPWISKVKNALTQYGTGATFSSLHSLFPDVLFGGIVLCILFGLYEAFERKESGLFAVFVVLLGLSTRFVMGFSPTIWASGERTFAILYFSLIVCSVMLFNQIAKYSSLRFRQILFAVVSTIAVLSYINTLMTLT